MSLKSISRGVHTGTLSKTNKKADEKIASYRFLPYFTCYHVVTCFDFLSNINVNLNSTTSTNYNTTPVDEKRRVIQHCTPGLALWLELRLRESRTWAEFQMISA